MIFLFLNAQFVNSDSFMNHTVCVFFREKKPENLKNNIHASCYLLRLLVCRRLYNVAKAV